LFSLNTVEVVSSRDVAHRLLKNLVDGCRRRLIAGLQLLSYFVNRKLLGRVGDRSTAPSRNYKRHQRYDSQVPVHHTRSISFTRATYLLRGSVTVYIVHQQL
jgi:hypothetical protein